MGCSNQGAEITPAEPAQDNACEGKEVNFFSARQPQSRIYLTLKINTMILFRINNFIRIVTLIILFPVLLSAQEKISGIIKDKNSGEPIVNAVVHIDSTFIYSLTNQNGEFKFSGLKGNSFPLSITHIAYITEKKLVSGSSEILIDMLPKLYLSEEVNISATRVDNRSSVAFSELNKSDIEKHNLGQDLPFLLNMTPSVVVTSDGGTGVGYTGIRIRGSDATRVNVTINGIPVNDAESHQVYWVDIPDLASSVENIQIQRGLGSSTNGAGAFGGSINILSNKLSVEPFASASSSAGSFHTFKNTIMFGSGILSDAFAIEGRVSKINSGGYIDRAASDLSSFYLSGGYYGKNNSLRLIVLSGKEKTYQAWYGVPQDSLSTNRTYNPAGEYYDQQGKVHYYENQTDNYQQDYYQLIYSGTLNQYLNINAAMHYTKGKGYYEEYEPHDDIYGNGLLSTYGIPDFIVGNDTITSTDLIRQRWLDNNFYGFTFSANYSKNKVHFTLGGAGNQYKGKHYDEIIWMKNNFGIPPDYRYSRNVANKDDFNVFAKLNYEITNQFNLFGDLQYRTITYEFEGFDNDLNNAKQKVSLNFLNPKAGISFAITSNQKIYSSLGIGHKEPVRDDYVLSSPTSRPKPEEMFDVETGYKFTGKNITFGVNCYFMNYKNQLVLTGKINDVGAYPRQNVGKSYRTGVEAEIGWNIFKNLNISGNLTISKNKIQAFEQFIDSSDDTGNYTQMLINLKKTDISFSPNIIASGDLRYSPFKNTTLDFISKYVGKQFLDNTSNKERMLKSYLIHDLLINYHINTIKIKDAELKFAVYNVFNQKYESNGSTFPYYYNGVFSNSNYYFPQAKMSFMVGVVVKL